MGMHLYQQTEFSAPGVAMWKYGLSPQLLHCGPPMCPLDDDSESVTMLEARGMSQVGVVGLFHKISQASG